MQLDMHYYGTYAMARAAGISQQNAQTIARCAQFVDDNSFTNLFLDADDGSSVRSRATAHTTADMRNIDGDMQRQVWVPFISFQAVME